MAGDNSREVFTYIRERDEAREELKKVQEELQSTKSKLYDANSKVEELKKSQPKNDKSGGQKGNANKTAAKKGAAPAKGGNRSKAKPAIPGKASELAEVGTSINAETPSTSIRHPPIEGMEHLCNDTYAYYRELANRLPLVRLQLVLDAEVKFNEADINNDGVIDKEELQAVLDNTVGMFTPDAVDGIMNAIDKDSSGGLDFFEVLQIMDRVSRKKTQALPQSIQQNSEKVCAIQ